MLSYHVFLDICVIDQARGQDGWILTKFFFAFFMDRDEVEVHNKRKKERGQYPAILTQQAWSIKDFAFAGPTRAIPSGKDRPILPARVANQNTGFASSCPLAGPAI